jgi:hypothetical protein
MPSNARRRAGADDLQFDSLQDDYVAGRELRR